ncbi:MAG: hypothetical protein F6J93_28415 [Oscillatoria sp. SIO1A7]|nr:hypothetical protein [Oscillatoria sp. SIO1A7]
MRSIALENYQGRSHRGLILTLRGKLGAALRNSLIHAIQNSRIPLDSGFDPQGSRSLIISAALQL